MEIEAGRYPASPAGVDDGGRSGRHSGRGGDPQLSILRQEQMVRAATQAVYTDMMLLKPEAVKRNKNLSQCLQQRAKQLVLSHCH